MVKKLIIRARSKITDSPFRKCLLFDQDKRSFKKLFALPEMHFFFGAVVVGSRHSDDRLENGNGANFWPQVVTEKKGKNVAKK